MSTIDNKSGSCAENETQTENYTEVQIDAGAENEERKTAEAVSQKDIETEALSETSSDVAAGTVKKKRGIIDIILIIFMLACVVVLAASLFSLGKKLAGYRVGDETTKEAEQLSGIIVPETDDPYSACLTALKSVDLEAMREVNSDVIGWIIIPDTEISYPVVQVTGDEDAEYYLSHTWNRESSCGGAIFMKETNAPDLSDFNTVIYGHRMKNGSMFAGLKYYREQEFFNEHPYVGLMLMNGTGDGAVEDSPAGMVPDRLASQQDSTTSCEYYVLPIFTAFYADTTSNEAAKLTYLTNAQDAAGEAECLDRWKRSSVIDSGITPAEGSRVLTLSTCTGYGYQSRWVIKCCTAVK